MSPGRRAEQPNPRTRAALHPEPAARSVAGGAIALWLCLAAGAGAVCADDRPIAVEPREITLKGSDARAQILVSFRDPAHPPKLEDLTEACRFVSLNPAVAQVGPTGAVQPQGDGEAVIRVSYQNQSTCVNVKVEDFHDHSPVDFADAIIPILTKAGCNSGSCHGKSGGQNGFQLSLLGFDPAFDYESIVRDARGRRVFPAQPLASLFLVKPQARAPHGGGLRIGRDSAEARVLTRWIAQGMPKTGPAPRLTRLEIAPDRGILSPGESQRLRVEAAYADGSRRDVTHLAQFVVEASDLAVADEPGKVRALSNNVGQAAVLARYQGEVAVALLTIPAALPARKWAPPPSANLIDPFIFNKLRELGLSPSADCTEAQFLRRSSLDIRGAPPSPDEVRTYLADRHPHKKEAWVDRLLASPEYPAFFALKWSAILRNERNLGSASMNGTFAFHSWIVSALSQNMPYDRFVAAILTAQGELSRNPPVAWYRQARTLEDYADDTAQLFLGVRIQCARCHHHPFEKWSRGDYFGFASFFSRIGQKPGTDPGTTSVYLAAERPVENPETGRDARPAPLGGKPIAGLGPRDDPRRALVDWLVEPDNPYFAKALVNRTWKHFFGRGLVDPEDDFRAGNPPSHPDLLNALAHDFVSHHYDLKHLIKTIVLSRAYDRSSKPAGDNGRDRRHFARFYPRRMIAEVLVDAIDSMTGTHTAYQGMPDGTRAGELPDDGFPSYFLDILGRPKRTGVCECERSSEANLGQALHLLSSTEIEQKLTTSPRIKAWLEAETPDDAIVRELHLLAFSREPTPRELEVCQAHLAGARNRGRSAKSAIEDLMWVVINSEEFLFIH